MVRTSKFLSFILRHKPGEIGLTLEHGGWASVSELLRKANDSGLVMTEAELFRVVAENDKQRFALTPDRAWIRANQGHSIPVELGLESREPPERLFHGTATKNLGSIRRQGLLPGKRQQVHLSSDQATAIKVGSRHGAPMVITVRSLAMHEEGFAYFMAENGVWLTDCVPFRFLTFPDNESAS